MSAMLRSLALARARALPAAAVVARRLPLSTAPRALRRSYATPAAAASTSAPVINYEPAKEAKHLNKVLIANRYVRE